MNTKALRIFLCCQQADRRHAVPAYSFWADYFRGALAEAGHWVIEAPNCDWAEGLLPTDRHDHRGWRTQTWGKAYEYIKSEHARRPIDLFLGYLFPAQVDPGALRAIRELGIPCVNFFCDNVREFRKPPSEFAAFDLHWVPEHGAVPMYRTAGMPVINAPMPCWLPKHLRCPPETETLPPTFVGTRDAVREELFRAAIAAGLDIQLRGHGWLDAPSTPPAHSNRRARSAPLLIARQWNFIQRQGVSAWLRKTLDRPRVEAPFDFSPYCAPAPKDEEYWQVIRECQVCVGVNRFPSWRFPRNRPPTYSRLRDIEAPMAAACYLTEWTEGIDQLYEVGAEIETFRNATELAEKTVALSRDRNRRTKMRRAAQHRALQSHSIASTVAKIQRQLS